MLYWVLIYPYISQIDKLSIITFWTVFNIVFISNKTTTTKNSEELKNYNGEIIVTFRFWAYKYINESNLQIFIIITNLVNKIYTQPNKSNINKLLVRKKQKN